ncbi:MAG: hypothetical protein DHS20C09_20640 [marine bacterium B5-7]|nr:MAG: hypothetical protein DHS20C09_20640 [marine bacterium B5-7]
MKAKLMKILFIVLSVLFSSQSYAVEFYQCIDQKGHKHFTNLSADSLDSNCQPKTDRYSYLLGQDYSNLEHKLENYTQIFETQELEREQTGDSAITSKSFIDPVKDLFDSDKALEQLLEASNKREKNMATEFFDARSNAVESVLSQDMRK